MYIYKVETPESNYGSEPIMVVADSYSDAENTFKKQYKCTKICSITLVGSDVLLSDRLTFVD